jgi:bifunctional non-homologous end joining protein LigD
MRYIRPARPRLRALPPQTHDWVHEVKFDGWRVQLHKHERDVAIYTKSGSDYTHRFPSLVAVVAKIPARSCIVDGELVANERS